MDLITATRIARNRCIQQMIDAEPRIISTETCPRCDGHGCNDCEHGKLHTYQPASPLATPTNSERRRAPPRPARGGARVFGRE